VDVAAIIEMRAGRYYSDEPPGQGFALLGDSRLAATFGAIDRRVKWVITSPPYLGMRTYVADQWLRNWFVGGPSEVDYSADQQLTHFTKERFSADLASVWTHCAAVAEPGARLVIRFGRIRDRDIDHVQLLSDSLRMTGWRIQTRVKAGSASLGRRQANSFAGQYGDASSEDDVWAILGSD
jgi:hypothetical protein